VLKIADAMAPSVLFIDEVEKALSGVANSGQSDGGVSTRLFGTFLQWLNDHTSDVFVIATCNNISRLPPEFGRAERFDGIFFLDLPDAGQRRTIWDLYIHRYGLAADQQMPPDADFTGAEIKACCRLAALLDVPLIEASQNVVPVSRTASESVTELREWASGRCLSADRHGLYRFGSAGAGKKRRSIPRDPSVN
jgi:SpoVK/Ycf46/Vps4 family AAA+-type ATPase